MRRQKSELHGLAGRFVMTKPAPNGTTPEWGDGDVLLLMFAAAGAVEGL